MKFSLKTFSLLAALAALALGARADSLTLSERTPGGYAYVATPLSGDVTNADYSGKAKTTSGFLTFCLEKNEYFQPGGTYNYAVNFGAKNGGQGGATNGYDPISNGTAYLYSQFAQGLLNVGGFTYSNAGYTLFQNAIWYLENETTTANSLAKWAKDHVKDYKADSNGSYGVYALNLTYANNVRGVAKAGDRAQDQLYYRVPDQGLTVALLGFSLLGLLAFRRRFAK